MRRKRADVIAETIVHTMNKKERSFQTRAVEIAETD